MDGEYGKEGDYDEGDEDDDQYGDEDAIED